MPGTRTCSSTRKTIDGITAIEREAGFAHGECRAMSVEAGQCPGEHGTVVMTGYRKG